MDSIFYKIYEIRVAPFEFGHSFITYLLVRIAILGIQNMFQYVIPRSQHFCMTKKTIVFIFNLFFFVSLMTLYFTVSKLFFSFLPSYRRIEHILIQTLCLCMRAGVCMHEQHAVSAYCRNREFFFPFYSHLISSFLFFACIDCLHAGQHTRTHTI